MFMFQNCFDEDYVRCYIFRIPNVFLEFTKHPPRATIYVAFII